MTFFLWRWTVGGVSIEKPLMATGFRRAYGSRSRGVRPRMKAARLHLLGLLVVFVWTPGQGVPGSALPASGLHTIETRSPSGLRELFRYSGDPLPFVDAHRAEALDEGLPENCTAHSKTLAKMRPWRSNPRHRMTAQVMHPDRDAFNEITTGKGRVYLEQHFRFCGTFAARRQGIAGDDPWERSFHAWLGHRGIGRASKSAPIGAIEKDDRGPLPGFAELRCRSYRNRYSH